MKEKIIQSEKIVKESSYKLYGLSNPGIPLVAKGERLLEKEKGKKALEGVIGEIKPGRFEEHPVSNLVFLRQEGEWVNGSWICEVEALDEEVLRDLNEPGRVSVRLLSLDEELIELSGFNRMVEIGFNVGGDEVVLKRVLLPNEYETKEIEVDDEMDSLKVENVFFDVWSRLGVGLVNQEWDERVKEHLKGNVRNLDKGVEYEMREGKKWVLWGGEWMWAGLLSDMRDIDRYLLEESKLADLKPGEFIVTKYKHSEGGAVSAGTVDKDDVLQEDGVVGDVQVMGEGGKLYQMAVEGGVSEIDNLIDVKVGGMLMALGFVSPSTQVLMPIQIEVGERLFIKEKEVVFNNQERLGKKVGQATQESSSKVVYSHRAESGFLWQSEAVAGFVDSKTVVASVTSLQKPELLPEIQTHNVIDWSNEFIDKDVKVSESVDWVGDVFEEENLEIDWDEGGDQPETPNLPEGGPVKMVRVIESEVGKVEIGEINIANNKVEVESKTEEERTTKKMIEDQIGGISKQEVVLSSETNETKEKFKESEKEEGLIKEEVEFEGVGEDSTEPPIWEAEWEAVEIPIVDSNMIEMDFGIPVGAVIENILNGSKAAEIMQDSPAFFKYYTEFTSIVLATFYAMLSSKVEQVRVPEMVLSDRVLMNRGSGLVHNKQRVVESESFLEVGQRVI